LTVEKTPIFECGDEGEGFVCHDYECSTPFDCVHQHVCRKDPLGGEAGFECSTYTCVSTPTPGATEMFHCPDEGETPDFNCGEEPEDFDCAERKFNCDFEEYLCAAEAGFECSEEHECDVEGQDFECAKQFDCTADFGCPHAHDCPAVNYVETGNMFIPSAHHCEFVRVNRRVRAFLEQHDESEA